MYLFRPVPDGCWYAFIPFLSNIFSCWGPEPPIGDTIRRKSRTLGPAGHDGPPRKARFIFGNNVFQEKEDLMLPKQVGTY